MFSKLWMSFGIAIQNIKSNILHTVLSTLGIVIGVGALVAILSLIDGLEEYARSQITETTSVKMIVVNTKTRKRMDGVWVKRESHPAILPKNIEGLRRKLGDDATIQLKVTETGIVRLSDSELKTATYFSAALPKTIPISNDELWKGKNALGDTSGRYFAILSYPLAAKLKPEEPGQLIGEVLKMDGVGYQVAGITHRQEAKENWMWIPITSFSEADLKKKAPQLFIEAPKIEKVDLYKAKIKDWLSDNFENAEHSFQVFTNKMRLQQANRGMLLFKIIMGLITGISVIVGGIGIMNVLLISVTERTTEIGIRKAAGAKRGDIILQFLSESVTVSVFGSFLGVLLGVGVALLSVPLVKLIVDIPFQAGFTLETLILVSVLAVMLGIIFGTYPAMRAARLTPVEAIRRE